MSGDINIMCRR